MSCRIPPVPPGELRLDQKRIYNAIDRAAESILGDNVPYKRPSDGALIGPFAAFIETPEMGTLGLRYLSLQNNNQKTGSEEAPYLSPAARETAILAVAVLFRTPYAIFAHSRIALDRDLLEPEHVDAIVKDGGPQRPAFEEGGENGGGGTQCGLAYDVATALCISPHGLSQELWDRGASVLGGRQNLMNLIHCIGMYMYLCTVLNAMDAPSPEAGGELEVS